MEKIIEIPIIKLEWSKWYNFSEIEKDARQNGINVSNKSGVYEVINENGEILHIGRASNLRMRVKQGLVKDKTPHSTRKRMLEDGVNFNNLKVRWAVTDWPNSVEEFLHKKYKKKYGTLPKYTKVT
ncbi:MAG: GIY-YIG nuclease family protein [Nautiliaceae bacterium]